MIGRSLRAWPWNGELFDDFDEDFDVGSLSGTTSSMEELDPFVIWNDAAR